MNLPQTARLRKYGPRLRDLYTRTLEMHLDCMVKAGELERLEHLLRGLLAHNVTVVLDRQHARLVQSLLDTLEVQQHGDYAQLIDELGILLSWLREGVDATSYEG